MGVIFLSRRHFMLQMQVSGLTRINGIQEKGAMDDYQEELLEYQAFELDPLEPADDATEL